MTTERRSTALSVRAEARRLTAPDEAQIHAAVRVAAGSTALAAAELRPALHAVLADLAELGGVGFTVDTRRARLTWSTQSMRTQEEHDHDKRTGRHGPTGRHQATVGLLVTVRDFSLLTSVSHVVIGRDLVQIESVSWSVDDDNGAWAQVRAEAIAAALRKGQDYAAALGGTVTSVDHIADAGLLGGDTVGLGFGRATGTTAAWSADASGGDDVTLDPVPQLLRATIEARFTAAVAATTVEVGAVRPDGR